MRTVKILPDELITEILSYLTVKILMRMRSVCKAWKILISNPTFVNLHLQRSPPNALFTLLWVDDDGYNGFPFLRLAPFPVHLLENSSTIVDDDAHCCSLDMKQYNFVGSYNGLVCCYDHSYTLNYDPVEYWLSFRNPAMGTKSKKLGRFIDFEKSFSSSFKFSFGYDNSSGTYKVVAFRVDGQENAKASWRSVVRVFNYGDNSSCSWRKIQSFPVAPLSCLDIQLGNSEPNDGVHFSGTINWVALANTFRSSYNYKHIDVENFVILSLSLSTETYTQLLLPKAFNEVPRVQPTLRVLRNFLCFSHDFRGTEFVIWQMREFGVRESWTQLIKVSYQTLQMENLPMDDHTYDIQLLPLYLSENSDMLLFANNEEDNEEASRTISYNRKDDRVKRTRFSKDMYWFSTMEYVESLVPIT